jgi:hypothetical protein
MARDSACYYPISHTLCALREEEEVKEAEEEEDSFRAVCPFLHQRWFARGRCRIPCCCRSATSKREIQWHLEPSTPSIMAPHVNPTLYPPPHHSLTPANSFYTGHGTPPRCTRSATLRSCLHAKGRMPLNRTLSLSSKRQVCISSLCNRRETQPTKTTHPPDGGWS